MHEYANNSAVVFGATSGIGAATAQLLAERGASVTVAGRRADLGEVVAATCREAGSQAQFVATDITDSDSVKNAVARAVDEYGPLTMAVNNAGMDIAKPMTELTDDDFDALFNTNTRGTWHCLQHEIAAMARNGGGSIVNVNSIGSIVTVPGNSLYGASKKAVTALTEYAAYEYGAAKIRVNEISPGSTRTEMLQEWIDMAASSGIAMTDFERTSALRRLADPREQATAIAFLLSDEASYITGVSVPVDGGAIMLNRVVPTADGGAPPTPGDQYV